MNLQRWYTRAGHRKRKDGRGRALYCPKCHVPMVKHKQKGRFTHHMEEGKQCPQCGMVYNDFGTD